jgi:hypothetical protein
MSTLEKDSEKEHVEANQASADDASGGVDSAWTFLDSHRDANVKDYVDITALRRKIDWHIVPLMFCCYTMQFLDKVILNVSITIFTPNTPRQ